MSDTWAAAVLDFWFDTLSPKDWFGKCDATDQLIRDQFQATYQHVRDRLDPTLFSSAPTDTLAALIVLDQFPRNMFRGTPRAFESDAQALGLASAADERGLDREVAPPRRLFFYLPFEHSEAPADQDRSVALFERLGEPEYLRYAEAHRDVIRRFGRFPHRNAILGRSSSPEELAYLAQPGSGF